MGKNQEKSLHRELFGNAVKENFITPQFYCDSCLYHRDNTCLIFKRYTIKDFNRCLNHSNYKLYMPVFKAVERFRKSA